MNESLAVAAMLTDNFTRTHADCLVEFIAAVGDGVEKQIDLVGTGFVLRTKNQAYIATALHVVEDKRIPSIRHIDKVFTSYRFWADKENDIAIIPFTLNPEIDSKLTSSITGIEINKDIQEEGFPYTLIGFPGTQNGGKLKHLRKHKIGPKVYGLTLSKSEKKCTTTCPFKNTTKLDYDLDNNKATLSNGGTGKLPKPPGLSGSPIVSYKVMWHEGHQSLTHHLIGIAVWWEKENKELHAINSSTLLELINLYENYLKRQCSNR